MDTQTLSGIAGAVLSLLFSYIPGLSDWFGNLSDKQRSLVMLLSLLVTAGGIYALSCAQLTDIGTTCDKKGAMDLVKIFIAALVANQGTYLATRKLVTQKS